MVYDLIWGILDITYDMIHLGPVRPGSGTVEYPGKVHMAGLVLEDKKVLNVLETVF